MIAEQTAQSAADRDRRRQKMAEWYLNDTMELAESMTLLMAWLPADQFRRIHVVNQRAWSLCSAVRFGGPVRWRF